MRTTIKGLNKNLKIFLGDPCYVLSEEDYQSAVINNNNITNKQQPEGVEGVGANGNIVTVFCDTKYGDGDYPSKSGRYFGVDAGILGVSLITDKGYDLASLNELGSVIDVPENAVYASAFAERELDYSQGDVILAITFFDTTGKRISTVDDVIYTAEDETEKDDWDSEEDEYDSEDDFESDSEEGIY